MFDSKSALALQQSLLKAGFNPGTPDGQWGKNSQAALDASLAKYDIAWSGKVSPEFTQKTKDICDKLKSPAGSPNWLMSCMAFETGRTFSPTIKNGAGAPYYGLVQFGKLALQDIGVSLPSLLAMTAEQQLDCVYAFFKPYAGRLQDLPSFYMRILWPAGVDKPDTYVLWDKADSKRAVAYTQNRGLDINNDGQINRGEVSRVIWNMYAEGMRIENRRLLS